MTPSCSPAAARARPHSGGLLLYARRMFGLSRKSLKPDTDYAQADVELRGARDQALAGDWAAARRLIEATGRDWELRARRLSVLGIAAGHSPQWLDAWEAAVPG